MTDRLKDRWASRDFPVLVHIVEAFDRGDEDVDDTTIAAALGLDKQDTIAALQNLERGGYIANLLWTFGPNASVGDVTERALREAGVWPDAEAQADRLIWVLEQKVDAATSAEEQSRWKRIRDAIGSGGRDVAVEIAAAMAVRGMGG